MPVSHRRMQRRPDPPADRVRGRVDGRALRHIMLGFLAGARNPDGSRLTHADVESLTGVSEQRVSELMTRAKPPPKDQLVGLLAILDISPAEVFTPAVPRPAPEDCPDEALAS